LTRKLHTHAYIASAIILLSLGVDARDRNPAPAAIPLPVVPLPPPRPGPREPAQPSIPSAASPSTGPAAVGRCLDVLGKIGAKAEAAADIVEGACHAEQVVHLLSVSNDVLLSPPATLRCSMAQVVARWSNDIFQDSARQTLGEVPRQMLIGTSYQCRTQNRQANAKLSEHAFANALDVMGFSLSNNRALMIGPTLDSKQALFAAEIRRKACLYFSTVLGPGSDAEHGNHLHIDQRQRHSNFHICE
jgi:hypothetical protein